MNGREHRSTPQPSRLASDELEQAARHAAQTQLLLARASRHSGGETVRGRKLRRLGRVTSELVELPEVDAAGIDTLTDVTALLGP